MPTDPKKRQKKLQQKAARRKEKKHAIVRASSVPLSAQFALATQYPVLHSAITDSNWGMGMGQAMISRVLPNGQVVVAVFLVDRYCLGVKDATAVIVPRATYDTRFAPGAPGTPSTRQYPPAAVRKYVEGAVDYAQDSGISPHEDYQIAKLLFGDIDADASPETFEYGKNGKPMFINGPYDSQQRIREILASLERTRGPDGYKFTMILK